MATTHGPRSNYQSYEGDSVNLCPGHGSGGRHPTLEALKHLSGHDDPGMFGRMFPDLAPLDVPDARLQALAAAMLDPDPNDVTLDNTAIPAGFTYLGQFVDHDITLDLSSLSDKKRDPLGLENFRTPALDLDNVYGLGPDGSPHMYARDPLSPAEIASGPDGQVAEAQGLTEATPLWYYILKEARLRQDGLRLGPVGATIVSEVFVGLVHGDHQSYLWQKGLDWKPTLPAATPGTFLMADLLRLVDEINPIG